MRGQMLTSDMWKTVELGNPIAYRIKPGVKPSVIN